MHKLGEALTSEEEKEKIRRILTAEIPMLTSRCTHQIYHQVGGADNHIGLNY